MNKADKSVSKHIGTAADLEEQLQFAYAKKCVAVLDIYSSEWGVCKAISETFTRLKTEAGEDLRFFSVECNAVLESLKNPDTRSHQRPKNLDQLRDTLPEVWQPILEERRGKSEPFFLLYKEGKKMAAIVGVNTPMIRATVKDLCTVKTPASEFITNSRLQDFWDEYFNPEESEVQFDKFVKALMSACKITVPLNDEEKNILVEGITGGKDGGAKPNRIIHAEGLQKWFGEDEGRSISQAFNETLPDYEERATQVKLEREAEDKRKAEEEEKRKAEEEKAELERKAQEEAEEEQRKEADREANREKTPAEKLEIVNAELAELTQDTEPFDSAEAETDEHKAAREAASADYSSRGVEFIPCAPLASTTAEDAEKAAKEALESLKGDVPAFSDALAAKGSDLLYTSAARSATVVRAGETAPAGALGVSMLAASMLSYTAEDAKKILNLDSELSLDKVQAEWPSVFVAAVAALSEATDEEEHYWIGEAPAADASSVLLTPLTPLYSASTGAPEGQTAVKVTGVKTVLKAFNLNGSTQIYTPWYFVAQIAADDEGTRSLNVEAGMVCGEDLNAFLQENQGKIAADDKKLQIAEKNVQKATLESEVAAQKAREEEEAAKAAEEKKEEGETAPAEDTNAAEEAPAAENKDDAPPATTESEAAPAAEEEKKEEEKPAEATEEKKEEPAAEEEKKEEEKPAEETPAAEEKKEDDTVQSTEDKKEEEAPAAAEETKPEAEEQKQEEASAEKKEEEAPAEEEKKEEEKPTEQPAPESTEEKKEEAPTTEETKPAEEEKKDDAPAEEKKEGDGEPQPGDDDYEA